MCLLLVCWHGMIYPLRYGNICSQDPVGRHEIRDYTLPVVKVGSLLLYILELRNK